MMEPTCPDEEYTSAVHFDDFYEDDTMENIFGKTDIQLKMWNCLFSIAKSNNIVKIHEFLNWYISKHGLDSVRHFVIQKEPVQGNTIIHIAIEKNNDSFVKYILQNYALDLETRNTDGCTFLMYACMHKNYTLCEFLLLQGADPSTRNAKNQTVLSYACSLGHLKLCKLLITFGADFNDLNPTAVRLLGGCFS